LDLVSIVIITSRSLIAEGTRREVIIGLVRLSTAIAGVVVALPHLGVQSTVTSAGSHPAVVADTTLVPAGGLSVVAVASVRIEGSLHHSNSLRWWGQLRGDLGLSIHVAVVVGASGRKGVVVGVRRKITLASVASVHVLIHSKSHAIIGSIRVVVIVSIASPSVGQIALAKLVRVSTDDISAAGVRIGVHQQITHGVSGGLHIDIRLSRSSDPRVLKRQRI